MDNLEAPFLSLLSTNMGVTSGERIVVFSDIIRDDEIICADDRFRRSRLHEAASALTGYANEQFSNASFVDFPATTASGVEPPVALWKAVFGDTIIANLCKDGLLERILLKTADSADLDSAKMCVAAASADVARVVIAMSNNSTSHTRFRWLANVAGARFASLPHFDPEMFFTSMAVDWEALAARTARVAQAVNRGTHVRVTTPDGTDLSFSIEGRYAEGDNGLLTNPGSFGNLPAGEAYLAPLEGTAEGVMVINYAPTRKLAPPLTLRIKSGNVVAIEGDDPHKEWLERKFSESPKNRNIAELGIGTNDRATRPDNVLEAEKILGTVHIALGDNTGFGGIVSTPFHEDYVLYNPTLTVIAEDGTTCVILNSGRMIV
jgi:leucyl aminopeptidase (aminopeptidase T)